MLRSSLSRYTFSIDNTNDIHEHVENIQMSSSSCLYCNDIHLIDKLSIYAIHITQVGGNVEFHNSTIKLKRLLTIIDDRNQFSQRER